MITHFCELIFIKLVPPHHLVQIGFQHVPFATIQPLDDVFMFIPIGLNCLSMNSSNAIQKTNRIIHSPMTVANFLFLERFYCSCFKYWSFSNKVFLKIKSLKKKILKWSVCLPIITDDDPAIMQDPSFQQSPSNQRNSARFSLWCQKPTLVVMGLCYERFSGFSRQDRLLCPFLPAWLDSLQDILHIFPWRNSKCPP